MLRARTTSQNAMSSPYSSLVYGRTTSASLLAVGVAPNGANDVLSARPMARPISAASPVLWGDTFCVANGVAICGGGIACGVGGFLRGPIVSSNQFFIHSLTLSSSHVMPSMSILTTLDFFRFFALQYAAVISQSQMRLHSVLSPLSLFLLMWLSNRLRHSCGIFPFLCNSNSLTATSGMARMFGTCFAVFPPVS
jgi:hypothetical protein